MKNDSTLYSKLIGILSLCLLFCWSCSKSIEVQKSNFFLSEEFNDNIVLKSYSYDKENKLNELITRRNFFDPVTQTNYIDSTLYSFHYREDGKIDFIIYGNQRDEFEYNENILNVSYKHGFFVQEQITFFNYNQILIDSILINHYTGFNGIIYPFSDVKGNITYALGNDGIPAEEAFQEFVGKMYSFVGIMTFDEHRSIYENFEPEIQLWLNWNKNPNNLVSKSLNNEIWEYSYEYNLEGLPISAKRVIEKENLTITQSKNYSYQIRG